MHRDQPPPAQRNTFDVGGHDVVVAGSAGRYTVSVDGEALPAFFATMAAAWEAGVREAYRLDGPTTA